MSQLNLALAKLFDLFKSKYPHTYLICFVLIGGLVAIANNAISLGFALPVWAVHVVDALGILYALLGGTDTKMLIATGGIHTSDNVQTGSYLPQDGKVSLPVK